MSWREMPQVEVQTAEVQFTLRNGSASNPLFVVILDEVAMTLPNEAIDVYALEPIPLRRVALRPINQANQMIPDDIAVAVYADGGSHSVKGGPAAAAIVCERYCPTSETISTTECARFYSSATNNSTELAAAVGALRFVHRTTQAREKVVVIVDSLNTYRYLTGQAECKTKELRPLFTMARDLFLPLTHRVILAHMNRSHGNPADKPCNQCMARGQDLQQADLFPDCPVYIPRNVPQRLPPAAVIDPAVPEPLAIETLEDFIQLRYYKCRSSVPQHCQHLWGSIVARQVRAVHNAPDPTTRDRQIVELLALPTRYLPSNASTTRVVQHLKDGIPFAISRNVNQRPRDDAEERKAQRLKEAVHRLAMDRKLRSANKLIQAQAEAPDMPFDEKLQKLKAKIIERNPDDDQPIPTFERKEIPAISGFELKAALKNINRQCATSIDGWSKDLLNAAFAGYPSLADEFASILTILLSQPLSPLLEDILRCARLVGVPKQCGGIRPIAIAGLFMKLLGTVALKRDDIPLHKRQFAVTTADGCFRIIHQIRDILDKHMKDDDPYVAIKFDARNAFGEIARAVVRDNLEGHPVTTQQYYRLCYGAASPLIVFDKNGFARINMDEGVRQGDSTSTFFFCVGVDRILKILTEQNFLCWMYCDDLTIVVRRSRIKEAMDAAVAAFASVGLTLNVDKTGIYDPTVPQQNPFVVLGTDIANTPKFAMDYIAKQRAYFDLLLTTPMHPQLKVTLLRLCGSPRLRYYLSTTPPQAAAAVCQKFDDMANAALKQILQLDRLPSEEVLHDALGAGLPHYPSLAPKLFDAAKSTSLFNVKVPVELVTRAQLPQLAHNLDAHWMWFDGSLTSAEFIAAMSIRLRTLPPHLRVYPCKCDCGAVITSDEGQIHHTFTCDRFTSATHTVRHNMVRDAIAREVRAYQFATVIEPTCYAYEAGKKRPDLLIHASTPIAIDFTIVQPDAEPGKAAERADQHKIDTHRVACQAKGHIFTPAACEMYGTIGKGFTTLFAQLTRDMIPGYHFEFKQHMMRTTANTLAKSRAAALFGVRWRQSGST